MQFPKSNNLNLLRLFFAVQVLVVHAGDHLGQDTPGILSHLAGVPAFFFVSGFLIYSSYLNSPNRHYWENRALRLMPGLLLVTIGSTLLALYVKGINDVLNYPTVYMSWFIGQITLGQAYNPELFREIGVGVLNGSLWTITVEILFYVTVPLIFRIEQHFRHAVVMLTAISFCVYSIGPLVWTTPIYRDKTLFSLLSLTPVVWGWMFGIGIIAVKNFHLVVRYQRLLPLLLIPMIAMSYFGSGALSNSVGNSVGLLYFIAYAGVIFWLAFGTKNIGLKTDISYGVYIWHMPVINYLLVTPSTHSFLKAVILTCMMATASWIVIEKPALKLKRKTLAT